MSHITRLLCNIRLQLHAFSLRFSSLLKQRLVFGKKIRNTQLVQNGKTQMGTVLKFV